jgi:predicted Ser/Thr protein kinase
MEIYSPAEDSHLLAEAVEKHAFGNVLDMGTGSGIQAATALKCSSVVTVTAADINPTCRREIRKLSSKIKFVHSDLFRSVPRQEFDMSETRSVSEHAQNRNNGFDTIIFNPPYLPQDKGIVDVALYGGKKGYEITGRFLSSCSSYLSANGIILLLFSSHTNKQVIDRIIAANCLDAQCISEKRLPLMETLYIYRITKSHLLRELEHKNISAVKKFAEGNRGIIYTGVLHGRKIAVKAVSEKSPAKNSIENESSWLEKLNAHGIGPNLIGKGSNYFIYHFVKGDYILDYIAKSSREKVVAVLKNVMLQCRTLDTLKVNKLEMGRPQKHILVSGAKVAMLDFERCKSAESPKNVTQFCQFIGGMNLAKILKSKNITINRNKLLGAAAAYKKEQSSCNFGKIIRLI